MMSASEFSTRILGIYVASGGERVSWRNGRVEVTTDGGDGNTVFSVPVGRFHSMVVAGADMTSVTGGFMRGMEDAGIPVVLADGRFRPFAVVGGGRGYRNAVVAGQFSRSAELESYRAGEAVRTIREKMSGQLSVLLDFGVGQDGAWTSPSVERAAADVGEMLSRIDEVRNMDDLRGLEGAASRAYFGCFGDILGFPGWRGRFQRLYPDIPNLLLDVGYHMLTNVATCTAKLAGLDPHVGFMHTLFHTRCSLSCDVVEPFRHRIDRVVAGMFREGLVDPSDFTVGGDGRVAFSRGKSRRYVSKFVEIV